MFGLGLVIGGFIGFLITSLICTVNQDIQIADDYCDKDCKTCNYSEHCPF